jgi:FixJ family two-component response regulator
MRLCLAQVNPAPLDQGPISKVTIFHYVSFRNLPDAEWSRRLPTPLPNLKPPLIAIVDDDESVCRALKRLVRSLGMNAEIYVNGAEFVELIEDPPLFRPDCVVLDAQMPGMSGLEVQAGIFSLVGGAIPIIFVTAHDDRVIRAKALAAGAVAFLRKPFDDALFVRTLDAALGRNGTGQNHSPAGDE